MTRRSLTSSMLVPCLIVWSTTAWAQGPATTTAPTETAEQPTVTEQAPVADAEAPPNDGETTDAETIEAAPAPSEGTGYPVAEVAPEGLPAYDAELPTYDVAPTQPPLDDGGKPALRYAPKDGRGLISLGGIMAGGGTVLTAASIGLLAANEDVPVWIAGSVLGGLALAGGIAMLVGGKKRLKSYQTWEADLGEPVPRQGSGLRAAGMGCLIGGGFGAVMGGISLALQDDEDPPYGEVLLGLGLSSGVAGIVMVAIGIRRENQFKKWRRGETTLVPTVGGLRGGASVGVAGRF
ncbi:MAG: hypothetical protein KC457_11185 [Myxococcales bacterium]|nr:hypothetical protein [Myxococcales bacterium]